MFAATVLRREAKEIVSANFPSLQCGINQIWRHTSANQLTVYSGTNGRANQQWLLNGNGTTTGVAVRAVPGRDRR